MTVQSRISVKPAKNQCVTGDTNHHQKDKKIAEALIVKSDRGASCDSGVDCSQYVYNTTRDMVDWMSHKISDTVKTDRSVGGVTRFIMGSLLLVAPVAADDDTGSWVGEHDAEIESDWLEKNMDTLNPIAIMGTVLVNGVVSVLVSAYVYKLLASHQQKDSQKIEELNHKYDQLLLNQARDNQKVEELTQRVEELSQIAGTARQEGANTRVNSEEAYQIARSASNVVNRLLRRQEVLEDFVRQGAKKEAASVGKKEVLDELKKGLLAMVKKEVNEKAELLMQGMPSV